MQLIRPIDQYLAHAMALLAPPGCPGCQKPANRYALSILCPECRPGLKPKSTCLKCGRHLHLAIKSTLIKCTACQKEHYYFQTMTTIATYQGVWKKVIVKLKIAPEYHLKLQLAHFFIKKMLTNDYLKNVQMISAVPARSLSKPGSIISVAKIVAKAVNRPFLSPLSFVRKTSEQHRLNRKQRLVNMKNSMLADPGAVKGKTVLVIDDVFTTGATLNECSRALRKAGALEIHGLTLAKAATIKDG